MAVLFIIFIAIVVVAGAFILNVVFTPQAGRRAETWEGIVTGKSRGSPDGHNTHHYITVKLDKGGTKKIQINGGLWKFLHKGDKVTKHAGHYDPSKD